MPKYAILEAPSALGHVPEHLGAERAPDVLLGAGLAAVLDGGEFPVVLGGDCSIVLGAALALKRRGRHGLLYIDGDADLYQPEVNPIAGAASASDLAFATGRGPGIVCDLEGQRPLVRDDDVVVLPAVTLPTGNGEAASHCRRRCWSWIASRSAEPVPPVRPSRPSRS